MSKQTKQFFEQLKASEQPSLVDAIREAAGAAKSVGGQLWDGMKPMFDHGRTEMAAALFAGSAHVMYMKGQEGIEQGQDQVMEQTPPMEQSKESPEQAREGREM